MGRERARKSISSADLTKVLEAVHEESLTKKTENTTSYDFELARPFLKDRGLGDHVLVLEQGISRSFPINSERNTYEMANLIFRNLEIELERDVGWDKDFIWVTERLWAKWHFEHCKFKPASSNMQSILFGSAGPFRFFNNEFEFSNSKAMGYWLFGFASGSRVAFQRNDFKSSNIQIPYIGETSRHGASSIHVGLNGISFLGNRGIDSLYMRCRARNYVFKGINHINHLAFSESDSNFDDLESIYFSSRERIDPNLNVKIMLMNSGVLKTKRKCE